MSIVRPAAATLLALASAAASAQINLASYTRVGVYNLPSATTGANLLANEASAVTYNWDTDTLFVVGDGGTAIVEVSKTGQLIGSMALSGFIDQNVGDPEGITYAGNGQFVLSLERIRQAAQITYVAGGTATLAITPKITLGPPGAGNNGNEGIAYDPLTGGYIVVKQQSPQQVFQTALDFAALTSSNGNGGAEPTGLFSTAGFNAVTLSDIATLSTLPAALSGADAANLLVLSLSTGRLYESDRSGNLLGELLVGTVAQGHEGVTIDFAGNIYIVNENGGGSSAVPQLWVYAAPVPEVSSGLMLAGGLGLLAWLRRRSRG